MRLSYTVKPMSYILWPPLALQNKRDFRPLQLQNKWVVDPANSQ